MNIDSRRKKKIIFALPKGRLLKPSLEFIRKTKMAESLKIEGSRRLVFSDEINHMKFIILKPTDIPTYVEYGAADMGIVGKDILMEQSKEVYEPLDLNFGYCRLVVAEPKNLRIKEGPEEWSTIRIATKYPNITERYFNGKGAQVEVIKLDGSIELAPLMGLSERIVDLVASGETLRVNDLIEVEEIAASSARLIVNRASLKIEYGRVQELINKFRECLGES